MGGKLSSTDLDTQEIAMEECPALHLSRELCTALELEDIVYCHWKSTVALDRSARGNNDLDLLVSRHDIRRFTDILHRLGFKEARAPSEREVTGIANYYGYDRAADKLVHVHAHYQLIVGDDMTKNYHLPLERPYLDSAVHAGMFKVAAPEFELIVFVIRMVLKHLTWDAVLSWQGRMPRAARRELEYLQSQAIPARMREMLRQHLSAVDPVLFDRCMCSLRPESPLWMRINVGRELQTALKAYTRRPSSLDSLLKLWRRGSGAVRRRVLKGRARKRMATGAMIALVGGDGAGKSTAVAGLERWLSKNFSTARVHMGRPRWSWTTTAVRGAAKLGRRLGLVAPARVAKGLAAAGAAEVFPGYPALLLDACVARDRYLTYARARRLALAGTLVICDRFPLPQLALMDSRRIEQSVKAEQAHGLIKLLIELEKRYYQAIVPPDLLIVLKIDPEIAVRRKTSEDSTSVRARCQEIWDIDWQSTTAQVIDAGRSQAEVMLDLKSLIWSKL
jgi:thymidylate kinase